MQILITIVTATLYVVGTLCFVAAPLLIWRAGSSAVASARALIAVVGAVALVLTRLPDFTQFGALGMRAELRQTISDAKDTITLLRKFIVATTSLQVKMLATEAHLPDRPQDRDDQEQQLLNSLKSIGLTDEEVSQVAAADRNWVKWD